VKRTLDELTVDQLSDRFAEIGVAQDQALLMTSTESSTVFSER
jgi:hypothetical protein